MDKDFERMIEDLESGKTESISKEDQKAYTMMVDGIQYLEEEEFKEKIDRAHQSLNDSKPFKSRYLWVGGIAASLVGAFLFWDAIRMKPQIQPLQIEEAPTYADSATYDSLKNHEPDVDKTVEEKINE